jgi:hypothetical protein
MTSKAAASAGVRDAIEPPRVTLPRRRGVANGQTVLCIKLSAPLILGCMRARPLPLLLVLAGPVAAPAGALPPDALAFDYGAALGASLRFYEAQRAGAHGAQYTWRVPWRQPAALGDGADVGVDLSGGWFDAGDHVKFGLPMAYSATMLAWSLAEFPNAYAQVGELAYGRDNLRFVLDYFLQAYRPGGAGEADDVYYYQVGDPGADHAFWGPPQDMTMARPAFACTAAAPCSEVTAGTAAALAAGALVFADADPPYAARLLDAARSLYAFADRYRSSAGYQRANGFYTSYSGYWDELAWGAAWLHLATGDPTYLDRATAALARAQDGTYWAHSWDNVSVGTALLLARHTGASAWAQRIETHLEHWLTAVPRSPGGLAVLDQWGSLRYATTTAFVALLYSAQTTDPARRDRYQRFALQQLNYALGDNPRHASYVCGVGVNPPRNPHHRAAHDSPQHSIDLPADNRHELTGALVGGPASTDDFDYADDRHDYIRNEVATDYNAGYTAALAAVVAMAGGDYVPPTALPTAVRSATPTATPSPPLPPGGGLTTRVQTQSDWGAGYCADVFVTNATTQSLDWQVTVAVDGAVVQTWNATVAASPPGLLTAGGVAWNDILAPGATTSFGFCAARGAAAPTPTRTATRPAATATTTRPPNTATATRPPATATRPPSTATATRPPATVTPTAAAGPVSALVMPFDDWGTGYCANVTVSTTASAPVDWRVTFGIQGRVRELWNAVYSTAGSQVTAEGVSWNNLVTRTQPVTFGFCATR